MSIFKRTKPAEQRQYSVLAAGKEIQQCDTREGALKLCDTLQTQMPGEFVTFEENPRFVPLHKRTPTYGDKCHYKANGRWQDASFLGWDGNDAMLQVGFSVVITPTTNVKFPV